MWCGQLEGEVSGLELGFLGGLMYECLGVGYVVGCRG